MADRNDKRFHFENAGHGKTKVVETQTGLIYRTLDSRGEAIEWLAAAEATKEKR